MTVGITLLLIGIFYTLAWTFITSGVNTGFNTHIATLTAPMPEIDDFDTILGTDYFGYLGAWLGAIGAKIGAFFGAVTNLFITPELTMYGQTVDLTAIAMVNVAMIAFMAFGVYTLIAQMVGGIL